MEKYEITHAAALDEDAAVEVDEDAESFGQRDGGWLDTAKRVIPLWRIILARVIATANGAFTFSSYRGDGRSIEIVGRPSSVEIVRYMFAWLSREIERLSQEHGRGMGAVWRREFLEGAAEEIGERLQDARREAAAEVRREHAANPGALMRIEQGLQRVEAQRQIAERAAYKAHPSLKDARSRPRRLDVNAREAGARAARKINLTRPGKQIGGGS